MGVGSGAKKLGVCRLGILTTRNAILLFIEVYILKEGDKAIKQHSFFQRTEAAPTQCGTAPVI